MAVDVHPGILAVKGEDDTGLFFNNGVHAFKASPNLLEGYGLSQRKIKILGKTIITEVAALKCGSSLESQDRPQVGLSEAAQKPREAIVSFENVIANPHTALCRETIGKQGNVSLGNHSSAPSRF
jgi:hypothetical protein